ncbi:COP9 signalosome complex subunit 8 isoform X1 [Cinnamomum micranthum f. kanehirae]|uniref:COP9 signalosome complex subunit 8 isoform X1 n=1 Tax=Cinnamomum micranthum f. kanehirae TaxID=337451 RepID=A0A443Q259_9MAGN|nr:COP9 signalosome complex subunit 8 isoform X1 [Cinnamomum micranthum f. kanehirae]
MDFSLLEGAMASKSYEKIADICDDLMLQASSSQNFFINSSLFATSEGVFSQEGWPYAIHLLGHMYANDMNSARFLWKSIPSTIKESQPEIVAVWKIGQCLWTRNYAGVYEAIRGFDWTPQVLGLVMDFSGKLAFSLFSFFLFVAYLFLKA